MAEGALSVCHVFNMANNGYQIVKALRKQGIDADLIIDSNDFGMGLPAWEEVSLKVDPYSVNLERVLEEYEPPEWVKIWWHRKTRPISPVQRKLHLPKWLRELKMGLYAIPFDISHLFKMVENYDVLHLHPFSSIYLQFSGKPYVIHESGWIRILANADTPKDKLGRKSYVEAGCVVWTNPDTYPLLAYLNCRRLEFVPFIIHPQQYRPVETVKTDELLFFHPTRQVWNEKGNDRLLNAFKRFRDAGYEAKLRMVDWGWMEDVEMAKFLIRRHGLEDSVEWVPPYSKPDLIRVYSECDAVFDQFILGSGGTICYEAMSCKTPLVIYLNHWNEKCYGEMPPHLHARTENDILNAMVDLTDPSFRRRIGEQERMFTLKHNHPDKIAVKLAEIYEEVSC